MHLLYQLIAAAAPDVTSAGPSAEVREEAYRAVAGSSVFGAAFVIMLGIMLLILGYLLWERRKKDKEHKIERDEEQLKHQEERTAQHGKHEEERAEMREEFERERKGWEARFKISNNVLQIKDETIERIQEKRVELAQDVVAVSKDNHNELKQIIRLLRQIVNLADDNDSE